MIELKVVRPIIAIKFIIIITDVVGDVFIITTTAIGILAKIVIIVAVVANITIITSTIINFIVAIS